MQKSIDASTISPRVSLKSSPKDIVDSSLAIVGIDCLFPDANGIDQFWQNILQCHCSIRKAPSDDYLNSAGILGQHLAALAPKLDVRAQQFRLPPKITKNFDHRIFKMLELVRRVLEPELVSSRERMLTVLCSQKMIPPEEGSTHLERRARVLNILDNLNGIEKLDADSITKLKAGFVECYDQAFPDPGFDGFLAESSSLMTSIIPKTFCLGGGHIAIDATCASTIAAIQVAWDAILAGRNDSALIVAMAPEFTISGHVPFSKAGVFTQNQALPFDADASGFAIGEGIGVMLIKRLQDAEAQGDKIYAVIRGVGFSSDRYGSGFVSPSQEGQIRAMQDAYVTSGISPQQIRLLEAHATGTPKGDSTELESMQQIFGNTTSSEEKLYVGSVKGNIGHLLEASGMASIFKLCLSLSEGVLPPTIFKTPHSHITAPNSRFQLLSQPQPWPERDLRRLAAANSFGFGGVNAHIILESHDSTARNAKPLSLDSTVVPAFSTHLFAPEDGIVKTHSLINQPPLVESISLPANDTNASLEGVQGVDPNGPNPETMPEVLNRTAAEVEAEVVKIIAECTGYEVDELQLDHDLDADLGVDSIKHMEILLTVGERFRIQAQDGEQITDYATIQQLVTLAQTRQNTNTGEQPTGIMAELMAGLQAGDLPPDAAERLSQFQSPTTDHGTAPTPEFNGTLQSGNGTVTTPEFNGALQSDNGTTQTLEFNGAPTTDHGTTPTPEFSGALPSDNGMAMSPEFNGRQPSAKPGVPALALAAPISLPETHVLIDGAAPTVIPAATVPALSDAEVEAEVVKIIAECTGYEVDELQLDHDLDADLGVDSIKHMEILLMVGERFRIQAQDGEQITDYATIQQLVTLAQNRQNTNTGEQPTGMMAELMAGLQSGDLPPEAVDRLAQFQSPITDPAAAPTAEFNGTLQSDNETATTPEFNGAPTTDYRTAPAPELNGRQPSARPEAPALALAAPISSPETPDLSNATAPTVIPAAPVSTRSYAEVEAEVVKIIAECTGYEVDELQLDHDLDADLGVDSIKHMEILLTVGERFRIQAQDGEQITDYATIQQLVTLAQTRQNTNTGEQPTGIMAELMAGLQAGDLPPEAADRLSQFQAPLSSAVAAATVEANATVSPDAHPVKPEATQSQGTVTPESVAPSPELNKMLSQITQHLAAQFNYEPSWLSPSLKLVSGLGLSAEQVHQLQAEFGFSINGTLDLTIRDIALQLTPQPEMFAEQTQQQESQLRSIPAPSVGLSTTHDGFDEVIPNSVTPKVKAQTKPSGTEEWVLVIGAATPGTPHLAQQICTHLQHYQGSVFQVNLPEASHTFALVVNRQSDTLLADLTWKFQHAGAASLPEESLWWSKQPETSRTPLATTWLFPGSGSLYPGLLDELKTLSPSVGQTLESAQTIFDQITGQELCFGGSTDPLHQRPATVTTSAAIATLLTEFGITPSFLAGHSVGELTACYQAGVFDLAELIRLTTAPFLGLSQYPKGSMLAVIGPESLTQSLVQASQGRIIVSNRNSSQQLVVSGQQEDIRWFTDQALALGLKPIPLDVQTAYHSPVLVDAHQQYRQALQQTTFKLPSVPIVSGLTGDLLPWSSLDFAQTRALLDCGFIAPVNYVAQLQRLQQLGSTALIDIGPTNRLAKLARETLDVSVIPILETNRVKRNSRFVFLEALAQLHLLGAPVAVNAIPIPVPPPVPTAALTPAASGSPSTIAVTSPNQLPLDLLHNRPTLLDPIAIVGMGCIMPDAKNVEEFWQNLLSGHNAIRELPQDNPVRWNLNTYYNPNPKAEDKSYSKIGAFIPDIKFKPIEFRLTPKTANLMDRGQKMALISTREAFKDSGYHDRNFDRTRVRVIIGTSIPEAHDLGAPRLFFPSIIEEGFQKSEVFLALPEDIRNKMVDQARDYIFSMIPPCSEDSMPGSLPNIVAGRIAFCFDLQGGNVVLDAACAASLGALDLAIKSLRLGEIDMVVTGGSDSAMSAGSYVAFCKTYALSAKGSYPFDARADGFVMGEGCGIIILKRLTDAEQAHDKIYAVIRGCGSSSDGKGGRGITAPSVQGQVLAMQNAYLDAGIDPATIGMIEAHGTSTALGDTTEFASLLQQFGPIAQTQIYLGSVKSVIGHLKTAAGVAGLIKAALSVQDGVIPPTPTFQTPNPTIDLTNSPFLINTEATSWNSPEALPRRAAVNSFGFGGTNFHVIVEQYRPEFYGSEQFRQELLASRLYQDMYGKFFQGLECDSTQQPLLEHTNTSTPISFVPPLAETLNPVSATGLPASFSAPDSAVTPASHLSLTEAILDVHQPLAVVESESSRFVLPVANKALPDLKPGEKLLDWIGDMPPEALGASSFRRDHGVRFNYVAGAMAAGIGSTDIVVDMAKAGMLGFFGAGGVPLDKVESAIQIVQDRLNEFPQAAYGFNLLHNPIELGVEDRTVDLYLHYGIHKVSASAYLRLMPSIVRYRATGMKRLADGSISAPNSVFAKISSLEVAAQFMAPPPVAMLNQLVSQGRLTAEEAEIAALLPVAQDITAEADSGGHTDRRPLSVLLPQVLRLRDEIAARHGYAQLGIHLRVGAAGGLGDPISVRAAFALGADYVLTGTINQTTVQAGTSERVKQMLAESTMSDVVMAPAADMFEMGVQVQVLKRGTFYPQRARKLYTVYKQYESLDAIPQEEREKLERDIFRQSIPELWATTAQYWQTRDPHQLAKAEKDGKHKMALAFRAYLGLSSRWAQVGQADRKSDYQVWCGPAIGLFNEWVQGTPLQALENRDVAQIGFALLHGAAVLTRAERLMQHDIAIPSLSQLLKPVTA